MNEDGSVTSIYCHSDGYPDEAGQTLKECYFNSKQVARLLALGDLSELGTSLAKTVAYDRDCDETGNEALTTVSEKEWLSEVQDGGRAFAYLFKNGSWHAWKLNPRIAPINI